MSQVFVSYSQDDYPFVVRLVNALKQHSVPIWVDQMNIAPNISPDQERHNAFEAASHVLLVMSTASVSSQSVLAEISSAIDQKKALTLVMKEDCTKPSSVQHVQTIDFSQQEFDAALEQLLQGLPTETSDAANRATATSDMTQINLGATTKDSVEFPLPTADRTLDPADSPYIMVPRDDEPALQWPMVKPIIIVGRADNCDLVVAKRPVSRRHIRIYKQDGTYFVQDLGSKNGTWLNGTPLINTTELHNGDEIQLALAVRLKFYESG